MWSGPRNISTAMMRSFASRADTIAVDEPFYAAYLKRTGLDHPMRTAIIAAGETSAKKVAEQLMGPLPTGKSVFYQKHMTHHMIAGIPRRWIDRVENTFLIREPERVLASYVAKRETVELADIGYVAQAEIFDQVADRLGAAPPVVAAADVRNHPKVILSKLCDRLAIAFDPAMLRWEPGIHLYDGVWASHWYHQVAQSTGFAPLSPAEEALPELPVALRRIADAARPYYERLAVHRIKP
ncbi:MAG: HAD family hydrolase [Rhodobiaceae bacterium]|nr:HAD family hydrolase [Rhodobiaceae bacterium]